MARYGLVVGVAKYKSPLGSLSKPEGDAKAVYDLLKQHGDFEDIQVLTGEVTAKQLEDALGRLLTERADRNEAMIYYTGHAVVVKGSFSKKRGYFALSNTTLKVSNGDITGIENGIALDDLSGLIGETSLSNLVVLLDCCHSETFLEESQGFLRRAILDQSFSNFKKDYFLVSACRKFEEAYAMKSESYSIFTGAMLRGLARERANDRGVVDTSTMFGYVAEQLRGTGQEAVNFGYGRALRIVDYRKVVEEKEVDETCPYVGLKAFDESTAKWFFGRDDAWRRLQQKLSLSSSESYFAFVVGVSGSGKSSLVRAKLIPELKQQGYHVYVIKPRTSPLQQLKTALIADLNDADAIADIEDLIDSGDLIAAVAQLPNKPVLLVIDQFEEVFTLCRQKSEQSNFLKMLARVADRNPSNLVTDLVVVATMRSDFMGECNDPSLSKIINEHLVWLSAMTENEFKEAIAKPAQLQGYEFGEGLLEAILADIEAEPNCLPLLEFALQELWTHRDRQSRKLTFSAYRHNLKGIKGALDRHAKKLYDTQSPERQQWIRRILLKLVRTGQDVKDTRQPAQRQTLLDLGKDLKEEKEIETVLRALEGNTGRLLVAYQENEVAIVDLAHEALIDGWQQFVEWRQVDREVRRLSNRINDDFKEWQRAQDKFKFLLPEGIVVQIEEVETAIKDYLTKEQQEFVSLSLYTYKPWLDPNFIIEAVEIPAGTFWMGSPERKGYSSEKPYHQVTMQSFHMGKYPVTQAQWRAVAMSPKVNLDDLSRNPSFHRGDDNRPVEQITWHEAREFCDRLTRLAQLKGENRIYRLPTDAEWEYACRAGAQEYTEYSFGDDASQLDDYGWYGNNSGNREIDADAIWKAVNQNSTQYNQRLRENRNAAQAVGQKTPNAWGLYDMHGNVWEWCLDEWHCDYSSEPDNLKRDGNAALGEINKNDNRCHLLRGGSWAIDANNCRSAYRRRDNADDRSGKIGFRVVVFSFP